MVFVLSSDNQPLDPCHPARARELLKKGRAAIWRTYPFTIRLKNRTLAESVTHEHRVKIDPGSKTTGIAIVQAETNRLVWTAELAHRGQQIRDALLRRSAIRRNRRQRKTRYRQPRFLNRRRKAGWLAPSLQHRVDTTLTWVKRLQRFCPISALSIELVRFDTQLLQDAALSGAEYQQGTLAGYELREYILEKWGRKCAYCGVEGLPLQIEHLIAKSRGGSSRVSNLALACDDCNKKKGNRTAAEFGYPQLMDKAKAPLKDAAAINTTRWALWRSLAALGLPLEVGSGGRTKYNRSRLGLTKSHWADAACVGASTPDQLRLRETIPLLIRAVGHGKRQQCRTNASGFPLRYKPRARTFMDWKTGDIVRAVIPTGKYTGRHSGRIAIRFRPSFQLNGQIDVHPRYLTRLHRADGYDYRMEEHHSPAA